MTAGGSRLCLMTTLSLLNTHFLNVNVCTVIQHQSGVGSNYFIYFLQGSGVIKAGFAGDQIPKYCFPN